MRILLRDLTPGTDYTLQLRQNDGTNVSDWSRVFNLTTIQDLVPPAHPQNVTWVVNRTAFSGKWDAVTQNDDATPLLDFSHYIVRISNGTSSVDVKTPNTFYDLPFETNKAFFLTPQATLNITVFAADTNGNISLPSSTVSATNPPPPDPTGVIAAGIVGGVSMAWDVQVIDDLAAYDVFMSTSSSSFTPGSGNQVWTGTSNRFMYDSSSLGIVHYFKIRSRDVFTSISNYVTVSATPISPTDVDTTAPGLPTEVTATMATDTNDSAFATATVSWTAPVDTDLAGYVVRYKQNASTTYNYVDVPVATTSITIGGLVVGVQYNFSVQSYDRSTNRSAFTVAVNATAANTAPSTPAAPTASANTLQVQVNHSLQKSTSGRLESDVAYLEVHLGTASTFTASDSTIIGQLQVEAGSTFVSEVFSVAATDTTTARWVRVIAVDRGGLKSSASAVAAVTIGLVSNVNIADATITSAKINNLDANKITAGTGIINNLLIKSSLTVDTGGIIQSTNYVAGVSGYQLTNNSLEINGGTIRAAALQLQDSANIMHPAYADFEFVQSWYTGKMLTFNDGGTTTGSISDATDVVGKFNTQCLKQNWTGGGTFSRVYQTSSSSVYNVPCEANTNYIFSGYFYVKSGAGAKTVGLAIKLADGTFQQPGGVSNVIPATGVWTRISGTFNTGANTSFLSFISLYTSGDVYVDGLQIERQMTSLTTPSQWKPPGSTSIDGGIIRTGEIRSTASANGLSGQPAWSINMTGGAQFGDATVRGRIVVGDPAAPGADGVNSRIYSANYVAGTTGWIIRNDGYAEFRNLAVNSIKVTALDSPMQNNTYAKLYDYMQDGTLWIQSGSVTQKTDPGAYSAESLFEFTGPGLVLRNAVGVTKVAFDPTILYRVSARVRAYAVANLNLNQGFEVDTTGWFAYASTTISRDTTKFFAGVASLKLAQNGSATGVYGTGNVVNVKPGYTYTFGSRILPNSTVIRDNINMNIVWKDSLGATISTTFNAMTPPVDDTGTPIPVDGTTWIQFNSSGVAPVGAVSASFEIQVGIAATATAGTLGWLDEVTITTPPRIKVGVFGFDNANNIIDWDFVDAATTPTKMHAMPTLTSDLAALTANQYMLVSNNEEMQIANGDASTIADWITVTGYLRGRGGSGTNGLFGENTEAKDPYAPASLNQSVRYLVPYVEFDVALGSKAQLDQFSIEAYESGAPGKIDTTDINGTKGISIESIQDDTEFDHAIRFYTGDPDEMKPGMIGHILDGDVNNAAHLRISPPFLNNQSTYGRVYMGIYDRNPNYIYDSDFQKGITNWVGNTATPGSTITWDENEGRVELGSLKITTSGTPVAGTEIYGRYDISTDIHPDLMGQKISVSGWFKANMVGRAVRLYLNCHDETGAILTSYYFQKTTVNTTDWVKQAWTMPVVVPDGTSYLRYFWWWNGATAGDTIWVDECQLETGGVSSYRDGQSSTISLTSDVIRSTGSFIVSTSDLELPAAIWGNNSARRDMSMWPAYIAQTDAGSTILRAMNYTDSFGNRSSTILSNWGATGIEEACIRIYGAQDDRYPGRVAITNTVGAFAISTYPDDGADMSTSLNVRIGGHLDVTGNPPWVAPTLANGVNYSSAYNIAYFKSNGNVYLRGVLQTYTKATTLFTLPTGYRPAQTVYLNAIQWSSTTSIGAVLLQVNTTGTVQVTSSASTLSQLSMDGLWFSVAPEAVAPPVTGDTTAPGTASGFSINAYSSGSSTGVYQLKWTNPSATDTAGVKLIWRTDRYPTVTIATSGTKTLTTDGSIITVTGTPSSAKSYNHSGIPVNKTIYYRVVAYDKSGNHSTYVSASRYLLASPITVYATDSDAYRLGYGGMWRNDGDAPYQGDWTTDDNHRGLFFYGTQIYDKLATGGVVRTPTKMTVYVQRQSTSHGNNAGVGLNLRGHTYSTKPSGDPVGKMTNEGSDGDDIVALSRGEGATITIPSSWYNNYVDATSANRLRGVGCYGSTSSDYLVLYGKSSGSSHGKITLYHKG
jgi:hypothetical protein